MGPKLKLSKRIMLKLSTINANSGSIPDFEVIRSQLGIDTFKLQRPCSNGERCTGLQRSVPQRRKGPDLKIANY